MKIQPYKQTTVESCLACCLLQLRYFHTNKRITKKNERKLLFNTLMLSRKDFVAGHLNIFEKQFKMKTKRYVHNKFLYSLVKKDSKTEIKVRKIDIPFIDSNIRKSPAIIIIDSGPLYKALYSMCPYHYPHWIVVYEKTEKGYLIYEPWEGKQSIVQDKVLKDCLKSYFNRLWGAPQMITISI